MRFLSRNMEIGLGNRTNTILQSAFFRITGVIPVEKAVEEMKHFIVKSYGKKGEDVVNKNYAAVDRGGEFKQLAIDPAWASLEVKDAPLGVKADDPEFIRNLVRPINAQDGDLLPVSAFKGIEDGIWQSGTSKFNIFDIANLGCGELRKPCGTYTRTCTRFQETRRVGFRAGLERGELYRM